MSPKNEPLDASYGHYTGSGSGMESQSYTQQEYEPPYASSPQGFDDSFADAVAERVVQRLRQEPIGKVYSQPPTRDKNMLRLITAVFFILMFIPFAFFFLIMVGGMGGWIAFGFVGFTIFVTIFVLLDKIK